ncbi:hypothetical protein [Alysiella filiformis]|uniref:hypothetical protein n=1 Tax=Alysiella filiformis TaxID=194196 RepID=UPI0015CCBDB9|nr:hypothetical protein [Alysiella filiformis]
MRQVTVNVPANQPSLPVGKRWREGLLSSTPSPQPSPIGRGGIYLNLSITFIPKSCCF